MRHGLQESRRDKRAHRRPGRVRPVLVWVAALLFAWFVGYLITGTCDRVHEQGETGAFCGPPPIDRSEVDR